MPPQELITESSHRMYYNISRKCFALAHKVPGWIQMGCLLPRLAFGELLLLLLRENGWETIREEKARRQEDAPRKEFVYAGFLWRFRIYSVLEFCRNFKGAVELARRAAFERGRVLLLCGAAMNRLYTCVTVRFSFKWSCRIGFLKTTKKSI